MAPRGPQRAKPVRDALAIEAKLAEKGEPSPAPKGSLRYAARCLIERAAEETAAYRELGDRLDGKVPTQISGPEEGPIEIEHTAVEDVSESDLRAVAALLEGISRRKSTEGDPEEEPSA